MTNATNEKNAPSRSGTFEPTVVDRRPEIGPASSIPRVAGTMNRPASVTEAPNPNPVVAGSSTNSGTSTNAEYIPNPSTSAARLVVQTPRSRIMRISTRGARLRDSAQNQTGNRIAAIAKRPSVRAEVQPQLEPSLTGTSKATSQPDSSTAPVGSIRPRVRTGDPGTNTIVPTVAATTATSGNQNSHWYDSAQTGTAQ